MHLVNPQRSDVQSLPPQVLYPHPPTAVWATAPASARAAFERLPPARMSEDERDARLERVIEAVELDYLLGRRARAQPRLQNE